MDERIIYLDNNATTPLHPEVIKELINSFERFGNPSSMHFFGREAIDKVDWAREQLALYGVTPGQTLYLGNDMLNDIWAAAQVGFKTVLFAGDARSLRLREDRDQTRNLSPDAVITELNQLAQLLD